MAISDSFKEKANNYPGTISEELERAMQAKGYVFSLHTQTGNGREIPEEDWEDLVDALGGEDAIEATFKEEGSPAFTVTDIQSGKSISGDGAIVALAELWLDLK